MGMLESIQYIQGNFMSFVFRELPPLLSHELMEVFWRTGFGFDVIHHQIVGRPFAAHVDDFDDVGMVELSHDAGFIVESFNELSVLSKGLW